MADRKQGAGLSSGSSAAVHKVNYNARLSVSVYWENNVRN